MWLTIYFEYAPGGEGSAPAMVPISGEYASIAEAVCQAEHEMQRTYTWAETFEIRNMDDALVAAGDRPDP